MSLDFKNWNRHAVSLPTLFIVIWHRKLFRRRWYCCSTETSSMYHYSIQPLAVNFIWLGRFSMVWSAVVLHYTALTWSTTSIFSKITTANHGLLDRGLRQHQQRLKRSRHKSGTTRKVIWTFYSSEGGSFEEAKVREICVKWIPAAKPIVTASKKIIAGQAIRHTRNIIVFSPWDRLSFLLQSWEGRKRNNCAVICVLHQTWTVWCDSWCCRLMFRLLGKCTQMKVTVIEIEIRGWSYLVKKDVQVVYSHIWDSRATKWS